MFLLANVVIFPRDLQLIQEKCLQIFGVLCSGSLPFGLPLTAAYNPLTASRAYITVPDPDLEIRGEGVHRDPYS